MKTLSVLFATFFVLMGCGKDGEITTNPAAQPVTSIRDVTQAGDRREFIGRSVEISSADAQTVVGNYVFWAGDDHSALPIVRGDKIAGPVTGHVKRGDRVRVTSTVRLLSEVASTHQMWETVSEKERQDILGAIVYIDADKVQVISSDARAITSSEALPRRSGANWGDHLFITI